MEKDTNKITNDCDINTSASTEQTSTGDVLQESGGSVFSRNREKTNLWENLFFVIAVVASLFLMYSLSQSAGGEDQKTLWEIFANLNWTYFAISLAIVGVMVFFDALKYWLIIKATHNQNKFAIALKTSLLGRYYDNITPFSSGGQPFQIFYLHSKGFSGGESSAIILIKYAFNMTIRLLICLALMIFNKSALGYLNDPAQENFYTIWGWIGFAVNCCLPVLILSFAIFPQITQKIASAVLKLLRKIKLSKSSESSTERAKRLATQFHGSFVDIVKKPQYSIPVFLISFVELFASMALPYFVILAFASNSIQPSTSLMLDIMTLNAFSYLAVTIIPTPGTSGAVESMFTMALVNVAANVLFWSVFGWRFLSYYVFIIIGLCMSTEKFVRNKKKHTKGI